MSKATEWYEAQMHAQEAYAVSKGIWAKVSLVEQNGPRLEIVLGRATVMPSADEAMTFARWLLDMFGEEEKR